MVIKFEKVSRFKNIPLSLPSRKTKGSAGYDFEIAEDIILPSIELSSQALRNAYVRKKAPDSIFEIDVNRAWSFHDVAAFTKEVRCRPTLVSTGMKCHLPSNCYLEISVRSSTPLKHWIILANGVGIIDSDYCNNSENEGEIFFQLINLFPFPIQLKKGETIGQGIIKEYLKTVDDITEGIRNGGFGSTT